MELLIEGLGREYQVDGGVLRNRLLIACQDVEQCAYAFDEPTITFQGLSSDIQISIFIMTARVDSIQKAMVYNGQYRKGSIFK